MICHSTYPGIGSMLFLYNLPFIVVCIAINIKKDAFRSSMVEIRILMIRRKPVLVYLREQEADIINLFPNHFIYPETFDIKPAFVSSSCILKVVDLKGKMQLLIDNDENLKQHLVESIPFILIGDGDLLIKVGNAMDRRQVKELDPFRKKKRMGGLFDDDDDDSFGRRFDKDDFRSDDKDDTGDLFKTDEDPTPSEQPLEPAPDK